MVPRTGLEPVLPKEEDFKSSVSTIPPPGQDMGRTLLFSRTFEKYTKEEKEES
jgi:hypothetical protein